VGKGELYSSHLSLKSWIRHFCRLFR